MKDDMKAMRHEYEFRWRAQFAKRLKMLVFSRGIDEKFLKETLECDEERVKALLEGDEFPTVQELLRLCYLCYDADEILFGARDQGLSFLLLGKL